MMKEKIFGKRRSLRWSMVGMLLFGWFFPLLIMSLLMIFLVAGRINNQVENTIVTSAEKAAEIYDMQLDDSIMASKNASYLPTIREEYKAFLDHRNRGNLYDTITNFLAQQYKFDKNLKDAILIFTGEPDTLIYTFNNSNDATYNDVRFFRVNAKDIVMEEANNLDTGIRLINIKDRTYLVRNLVDNKFRPYAVLVLELEQSSYLESMESIWGYVDAEIYVDDELFMDTDKEAGMDEIKDLAFSQTKAGQTNYYRGNGDSYVCSKIKKDRNTLTFLVRLDDRVTHAQMYTAFYMFIIIMIFVIPLVYLILRFFHTRVTKPVQEMVNAAEKIEQGQFGVQIEKMANSDEFYYMQDALNHMSLQLKNQFERIYLEEIALRDAKIMALQSQINPHFLNNTLEIINWEARLNENYKVSGMIEALSTMLEATTNRKSQSFISMTEELAYVDAYLYIISQRFGEKFQCSKEIDENLLDVKVPRLIIQPIVENAVEHGMDISKQGKIDIRVVRTDDEYIRIEVEDNGTLTEKEREKIHMLLSEEPDPNTEKRISLGIRNVDQRLKIIYGEECGLFINSNKEMHTVSTLLIKMYNENEQ